MSAAEAPDSTTGTIARPVTDYQAADRAGDLRGRWPPRNYKLRAGAPPRPGGVNRGQGPPTAGGGDRCTAQGGDTRSKRSLQRWVCPTPAVYLCDRDIPLHWEPSHGPDPHRTVRYPRPRRANARRPPTKTQWTSRSAAGRHLPRPARPLLVRLHAAVSRSRRRGARDPGPVRAHQGPREPEPGSPLLREKPFDRLDLWVASGRAPVLGRKCAVAKSMHGMHATHAVHRDSSVAGDACKPRCMQAMRCMRGDALPCEQALQVVRAEHCGLAMRSVQASHAKQGMHAVHALRVTRSLHNVRRVHEAHAVLHVQTVQGTSAPHDVHDTHLLPPSVRRIAPSRTRVHTVRARR